MKDIPETLVEPKVMRLESNERIRREKACIIKTKSDKQDFHASIMYLMDLS